MIVAIIRLHRMAPPDELIEALKAGGITHAEVTLPTPGALDLIERWSSDRTIAVGVGTVRERTGAQNARDAGAKFFVTPTIDPDVLEVAYEADIPAYPGALTPTEIETAYRHPAVRAVKVFPVAPVGGPAYVKAIKDPMPDIPLVPTGGVGVHETEAYSRLSCAGVGVGSSLVSETAVAAQHWDEITARARTFVDAWTRGQQQS